MARSSAHRPGISIGRLRQLFLHEGQGYLAGGCELLHGDHLPRQPASLRVAILAALGARPDGVAAAQEGVGLVAALAEQAAHLLQHPVEHLLDDDGDDVEERVDAANARQQEEEIGHPVEALVLVRRILAAHQVPKADGAEGDEAEVE